MEPLVSIIIPTWNRACLIGETLDSVIVQTYTNWECIVVDDDSMDYTDELLEYYCTKDLRIQYHHRPKTRPKGANACRNYGLELSKGDYVRFFDSDDVTVDNFIEKAVDLLRNTHYSFVFSDYLGYDSHSQKKLYLQKNEAAEPFVDYFRGKINLATGVIVWKREIISDIKFDETLRKSQELDFVFRLYKNSCEVPKGVYLPEVSYSLRSHSSSIVGSFKKNIPEYLISDIIVRERIISAVNTLESIKKTDKEEILVYTEKELEKSFTAFVLNSHIFSIIRRVRKLNVFSYKVLFLLIQIFLYKISQICFSREYRLRKAIKEILRNRYFKD